MYSKQYTRILNHSQAFITIEFPPVDLASTLSSKKIESVLALARIFFQKLGNDFV